MKIITNNVARDIEDNKFKYRGDWYDLDDFMATTVPEFHGWDGILADTYFSATLVKVIEHGEMVIVGRAYA
jgi:phenylalanyl-tRNA synthetase alpha subunit